MSIANPMVKAAFVAALATSLSKHPEVASERPMAVSPEGGREHDDVALVALNILNILDEEPHVLAVFGPLTFPHEGVAEGAVVFGAVFERLLDDVGLLAVERNDADRRR